MHLIDPARMGHTAFIGSDGLEEDPFADGAVGSTCQHDDTGKVFLAPQLPYLSRGHDNDEPASFLRMLYVRRDKEC